MKTRVIELFDIDCSDEKYKNAMEEAGKLIKNGGLVAFPTETVYGLGGDALNSASSAKIYQAKGRPSDNPLIVHIAEKEAVLRITKEIPNAAEILMKRFWPGPLTLVFQKTKVVPFETTGGLETVAIRMPRHPLALDFIRSAGGYVAAPSANQSGKPSPTMAKYVWEDMNGRIDMILSSDTVDIGVESTIVDVTTDKPAILRPGFITKEMLEEALQQENIPYEFLAKDTKDAPKAPGMKYRHYAPKGELIILEGNELAVTNRINELVREAKKAGEKTGVIATEERKHTYFADVVKNLGEKDNPMEIAFNLYRVLREFDEENVTKIYSESFCSDGMGDAIMNRLLKAAGNRVENVNGA
jgi:L-threonylcarbamoyladenylate synthase